MAGIPDLEYTERLVRILAEAGADLIELGTPLSDPRADGVRVADILGAARRITERVSAPLLLMTYYHPVYHLGRGIFCGVAAHAGVAGLLRQVPPENAVPLALGFGIATAEQAREAARLADAVVVGSALVRRVEEAGAGREGLAAAAALVRELATAVHAS